MTDCDRQYSYIAKTLDAPSLDEAQFITTMTKHALPLWRSLYDGGSIVAAHVYCKHGDIDLQTSSARVRDWSHFVLLEVASSSHIEPVLEAEDAGGLNRESLARHGVNYLSCEVLERPAGAGTAPPVPSPHWSAPPDHQQAAIEYIQIPVAHWQEYREFMRKFMGPVGTHLVRLGHSFQIQILEQTRIVHRDDTLPEWNRIHILWGDFEDQRHGFLYRTNEAIQALLGFGLNVNSVLNAANSYRIKPRMSRNHLVTPLCLHRSVLPIPGQR